MAGKGFNFASFAAYADSEPAKGNDLHNPLVIEDADGNQVMPHAGKKVTFRADIPWRLTQVNAEGLTTEVYCTAVIKTLRRQILAWEWTDLATGEPLPQPGEEGFEDALWDLHPDERRWLRDNCWQEEPPNG